MVNVSVLLAISDPNVGVVLSEYLRLRDFRVDYGSSASEAFNAAAKNHYDFCLFGLDSPDEQLQLITDIRRICDTPVFALQARFDKEEQIAFYGVGADDCLVQPLVPDLLICKMEAMLNRWSDYQKRLPTVFDYPDMHFDSVTQTLRVGNDSRHLSNKENGVLLILCRNANQSVERGAILKQVWLSDSYFNARSLSVYINHLRHYIEPFSPVRILSMRYRGYKLIVETNEG